MQQDPMAAYKTATALSVKPGRNGDFIIPTHQVDLPYTHIHAWQGYGISSAPGNRIFVADYTFAAFRTGVVKAVPEGLSFEFQLTTNAIGADYRMFPDVLKTAGANRLQTANLGPNNQLLITRNSDGRIYFLVPGSDGYSLGQIAEVDLDRFFLSAQLELERIALLTVEAPLDCKEWFKCEYQIDSFEPLGLTKVSEKPSPPFLYGVGRRPGDDALWYITDSRCTTLDHGIYHGDQLVLHGVTGGGLCFLEDGSCLVHYYGIEDGKPGAIIRIPAHLLPA